MEHATAPIYATQWHPEANLYSRDHDMVINHSAEAINVMQYFTNFFVNEARLHGMGPGDVAANDLTKLDIEYYPIVKKEAKATTKYMFYDDAQSSSSSEEAQEEEAVLVSWTGGLRHA